MGKSTRSQAKASEAKKENAASQKQKTDISQSISSPAEQILFLQRTIGNQAVGRLIQSGALKARKIDEPDDINEQEANRVAHHGLSSSDPVAANSIQRTISPEEEKDQTLQTRPLADSITPVVQRQMGKDEEEKKDASIQSKFFTVKIGQHLQRQPANHQRDYSQIHKGADDGNSAQKISNKDVVSNNLGIANHSLVTGGNKVSGHDRTNFTPQNRGKISKLTARKITVSPKKLPLSKPIARGRPVHVIGKHKKPLDRVGKKPDQKVRLRQTRMSRAQEQLRSAAAHGKRSIAMVPELTLPKAKSEGGTILIDTLRKGANKGRENLAETTEAIIRSTTAIAEQQAATVNASESISVQEVQVHVQGARERVSTAVEQHSSSVLHEQGAEQEKLAVWHEKATTRAQEEVSKRQQTIAAKGAEHASNIRSSGDNKAEAVSSDLSSASALARSQSGGGGSEGRAEVANRLGSDMAGQFDSASTDVAGKLRTHAGEAADELESHTSNAAASIGDHLTTLHGQLQQTVEGTDSALADFSNQSVATLQRGGDQASSELDTVEVKVVDMIQVRAGEQCARIHTAGAEAATGIYSLEQEALNAAQQQLTVHAERIVQADIDEKTAQDVAPMLLSEVVNAYCAAATAAHQTESKIAGHLSAAGHEEAASLGRVAPMIAANLATSSQTVANRMGAASASVCSSMSRSISTVTARGDEGIAKNAAQLDQVVGKAQSGYSEAEAAAGRSIDQHAHETSRLRADAMTGLHSRISQGQQRVDNFVADKGPVVQRSILGSIGNWFVEQFKDLWDMLSSPAFWVGLVITVVLFPVMGPGALVIGGLAAGIASGIEQNVKQGRAWYDPHNIIYSAFIGVVGGAAMALGIGVIIGLGLEGAAAVAAAMGLSVIIGSVFNVFSGEQWYRGLLANLLLAWLFIRIFGGRAPKSETPPERTPRMAKPPGTEPTGTEPPGTEPTGTEPTGTEPPGPRTPEPYNPKVRTDAELLLDRDPSPRPGETPEQATERVRRSEVEIENRRQMHIIEGLGEEPRRVNVPREEPLHPDDAHTIEKHSPEIQLEMPRDAAGNRLPVPTGTKSIEGRIFGDTGWKLPENNSFRWKSFNVLNRTVNDYIRANWDQIRLDLAERGEHSANFNAPGGAVGEGFFDPNIMRPGPRQPEAVFMETSLVRITIRLIPGPPPDFFIVTTFPNALGAPPRQ